MGTVIRSEISKKSRYYLPKERYLELVHFCRQYPEWKKAYISADGLMMGRCGTDGVSGGALPDPTAEAAMRKLYFLERIRMVEQAANEAAETMDGLMIEAVTEGASYECLNARRGVPCGKDAWYVLYRRFFWILDKLRR